MKPTIFNNRLSERWLMEAADFLADRPLPGGLTNSLLTAFENNFRPTPDGYTLEVAAPGMSKKDLKLEVANQVLTVQGQRQQLDTTGWFTQTAEFRSIQLYKTFVLPEDANAAGIRAKCKDGLLKISIPKIKNERIKKVIPVEVVVEPEEMSWWQKLTRPFKVLWAKLRHRIKGIGTGF